MFVNIFGLVVVVVDQLFKIGEMIQIGSMIGMVEDIGLCFMKIWWIDKVFVIIFNKMVVLENIMNLVCFIEC